MSESWVIPGLILSCKQLIKNQLDLSVNFHSNSTWTPNSAAGSCLAGVLYRPGDFGP